MFGVEIGKRLQQLMGTVYQYFIKFLRIEEHLFDRVEKAIKKKILKWRSH
jgi:hypothetical protein